MIQPSRECVNDMISSPETLPRMTWAEYLAYEQGQSIRHELVDGYLYAMTGASDRHEEIALNLASALRVHFNSGPENWFFTL